VRRPRHAIQSHIEREPAGRDIHRIRERGPERDVPVDRPVVVVGRPDLPPEITSNGMSSMIVAGDQRPGVRNAVR
jgi:hypothetical protein